MNNAKIEALKQIAADAAAVHDAERDRLAAAGLNAKARYPLLKPLAAARDAAHAEYADLAKGQIRSELNKIIAAAAPARAEAARARSPWKAAKFAAHQK